MQKDEMLKMTIGPDFARIRVALDKSSKKIDREVEKELAAIGLDIRSNIIRKMRNTEKSSRTYGKRQHRPSLPGNPPAIDSGRLVNSFEVNATADYVEVGTNVEYAKYLQNGTSAHIIKTRSASILSDGSTVFGKQVQHPGIKARPFLEPGIEDIDFVGRIQDAIKRGFCV